ncbi:MAG: bifunctional DNA primase/polymerase [Alphaproteobacteria bacterium]|nr:bifunctional DNA primase/polymerase [Alphaproteobacteria bacterium]
MTDMRKTAAKYLARGWAVVPIAAGGKHPLVRWQTFQERLPTGKELEDWFARWPDAGVGIVTGAVSNLVVLDVDPRHGGGDSLRALEREHGPLPHTIEAITGGGGRHVYFTFPGGELRNRTAMAPGIDLRAEGGLVVAPPSMHASGRRYAWEVSHHPDETELAAMPGWLLQLAQGEAPSRGHPVAYWRGLVESGVAEGERNSTIASLTGHLLWHGVDKRVALELLLAWNRLRCRPPLEDEEVAATVDSIARTHARHRGNGGAQG